ncbi:MAG: phosphatidylglycerophosphatase A [Nitrospiraceae bacterium]|nr:MAG: phosphatidylglycerophosphatase A [Nitrospiraceae bacterium]
MSTRISHAIATLGFLGYAPAAPGTFGSVAAYLLVFIIQPGDVSLIMCFLLVLAAGAAASHEAEKLLGRDSGHIIIDEFCGSLLSLLFVPRTPGFVLAAFVLFRAFDIIKPPPVRTVEKIVPGGAGIMLDDVAAGVCANLCLQIWRWLF